jgi:hypothetical protein
MEGLEPSVRAPRALDEAREAATFGIVEVKVLNLCVCEEPLDCRKDVQPFAHVGVYDHMRRIVCPKGNMTKADVFWNLIHSENALLRMPAHKDGAGRPVWRISRLMGVGQQEQFLTDFCINQTYAARVAWFLGGHNTFGVQASEL